MGISTKASKKREMTRIIEDYVAATGADYIEPDAVSQWALDNDRLKPLHVNWTKYYSRRIAAAVRAATFKDGKGREVRLWHAVQTDLGIVYENFDEIKPNHMKLSLATRRSAILADVRRFQTDFDSYNDYNKYGVQLSVFSHNYDLDLAELNQPAVYPAQNPEIEDEDDED